MNQEKIGKFIAECRKSKNMTQQELADKLGVTDRAISNWENGRRLPDYSIIESLCDELNITINDLFACEIIRNADYKEKSNNNIINILKSNENRNKIHLCDFYISIVVITSLIVYSFFKNLIQLGFILIFALLVLIINEFLIQKILGKKKMVKSEQTIGKIIKSKKIWWLKINSKPTRVTSLDGAKFPLALQVKYNVNDNEYIGKKVVVWEDSETQIGSDVIVSYNEEKPQKILSLRKR